MKWIDHYLLKVAVAHQKHLNGVNCFICVTNQWQMLNDFLCGFIYYVNRDCFQKRVSVVVIYQVCSCKCIIWWIIWCIIIEWIETWIISVIVSVLPKNTDYLCCWLYNYISYNILRAVDLLYIDFNCKFSPRAVQWMKNIVYEHQTWWNFECSYASALLFTFCKYLWIRKGYLRFDH